MKKVNINKTMDYELDLFAIGAVTAVALACNGREREGGTGGERKEGERGGVVQL